MPSKGLVVDANILVRAVLGKRVRERIESDCGEVSFFVPEAAYAKGEEHLPELVIKHGGDPEKALALLRALSRLVELIGGEATESSRQRPANGLASGIQRLADSGLGLGSWLSNMD